MKSQITSLDCETYDLKSKNDSIQNIADDLQRRNHDLTQMLETKEKELEKAKETIRAYQEDRFCQGGCAIYQYDKIHKLTQALDEIEEMVRNYDDGDLLKGISSIINKAKDE